MVSVILQVQVEAFDKKDAIEAVKDCFGEGDACGLSVLDMEVLDIDSM